MAQRACPFEVEHMMHEVKPFPSGGPPNSKAHPRKRLKFEPRFDPLPIVPRLKNGSKGVCVPASHTLDLRFQMGEHAFRFRCFEPREQPCGALEVVGCDRKLHPVLDCLDLVRQHFADMFPVPLDLASEDALHLIHVLLLHQGLEGIAKVGGLLKVRLGHASLNLRPHHPGVRFDAAGLAVEPRNLLVQLLFDPLHVEPPEEHGVTDAEAWELIWSADAPSGVPPPPA
eukprot:CAMPEP_0180283508 /NCGR_PEP_ID=MMETSP0988-20121125/10535_1 /TAXON_ID=697907 /ORGANISM="non described non described, Strain CCMP2293" /LENGTH=227 /DNA_ID=CAMNT_0022256089 /DNA_START=426 /DNA_END=1107 /DNA_ORIENTATION=-